MNSSQREQSPEQKKDIFDSHEKEILGKRIGYIAEKQLPETIVKSEIYLKGATDFVKWTSTVTIAAMLWIGNNITSITGTSQRIATLALICLAASLAFAIFTARLVIIAWKKQWTKATAEMDLATVRILTQEPLSRLLELEEAQKSWLEEQRSEYEKFISKIPPITHEDPKRFDTWVTWHLLYLLIGLSLYILAQITAS